MHMLWKFNKNTWIAPLLFKEYQECIQFCIYHFCMNKCCPKQDTLLILKHNMKR